ncbi:MAG: AMP-binding protein [Myxococcota bacterium]|nr:AMP-binding protein [Myxococcota bacterium]
MAPCRWYSLRAVSNREPSSVSQLQPRSAEPSAPAVEHNPANWIRHWAEQHGERTAIVFDQRESSWVDFENRVGQLADALSGMGVRAGDRVAIHLANHPAYLDVVFACARIGAISLPINLRLAPAELAFILGDAEPTLVVRDREHEAVLAAAGDRLGKTPADWCVPDSLDAWASELAARAESSAHALPDIAPVRPDDPMMIMYSSGTTGTPKGAVLPHRKALFNALNAVGCFAIEPAARCLVFAPLFHSLGLHILSLPLLFGGGTLVLHRRFEAEAVLEDVGRQRISYMGGVPTHYERLLDALAKPEASFDLSSLQFLFGAGAAIEPATVHAFADHGVVLKQGYGQTETSMLCCLEEADAARKAGSVGRPLEHLTLRVIDRESLGGPVADWRDVSGDPGVGEVGEVVVRGPVTMLGYWRNEAATRETLRDGWVLTGDLARIDPEGFVTLTGRSKEMFISGGENVYPAEIEAAYADHPEVREIAVVGVEDPDWGEVGIAFVVREPGRDVGAEALLAWGREVLAPFKLPRDFVFVDALPRTGSGKVQKFKLAASRE